MLLAWLVAIPASAQLAIIDDGDGVDYVSYRKGMEQKVFAVINQYRVEQHLPKLVWNDDLAEIARGESQDLAVGSADFSHTDFRERMLKLKKRSWASASENFLQTRQSDQVAEVALQRWLADSREGENIRGNWDFTGVGMWMNEQRAVYITQIYARTEQVKAVAVTVPAVVVPAATAPGDSNSYRGFTITVSNDPDAEGVARITQELKMQIDMVYAVGLPEEMLGFFRTVPIEIVSPWRGPAETYSKSAKNVRVSNGLVALRHKPFLIYELLIAYYHQQLEGGPKEAPLETFYQEAMHAGVYSLRSHMMMDGAGFFAATGTTYLYGVTAQEPFQRDKMQTGLPGLVDYFKVLFGPKAGMYQGSLNR